MTEYLGVGEREAAVLNMLRARTFAPIPRGVLGSLGIARLRDAGLIQRALVQGFWELTDEGQEADIGALMRASRPQREPSLGQAYSWEPEGGNRIALDLAWEAMDGLRAGDVLYGSEVRQSLIDWASQFNRARRFIYFTYPTGVPLKHIAWATRRDYPNWTDQNVSIERNRVGLPATRYRTQWQTYRDTAAREAALRARLRDEGSTDEEIREYFATVPRGVVL